MSVTTSVDFSSDHKLINFNAPNYLITNFDNLVRFKRVSRTSMLIHLMETYVRSEKRRMEDDNTLNMMISEISVRNKSELKQETSNVWKECGADYDPPMIPHASDLHDDDWSDVSGVVWLSEID